MPSNYTIAKGLQRIIYYREICGHDPGSYLGTMLEVQGLAGVRLDELYKSDWTSARNYLNEPNAEVWLALEDLILERPPAALKEDGIPLTVLDLTEIKGLGAKMARRVYDDLGVADLTSLQAALEDGRLSKVKGFGPKMIEKIQDHLGKIEKRKK